MDRYCNKYSTATRTKTTLLKSMTTLINKQQQSQQQQHHHEQHKLKQTAYVECVEIFSYCCSFNTILLR